MRNLVIAHTPRYADWVFDQNHPTQGRRFINGWSLLSSFTEDFNIEMITVEPTPAPDELLNKVHSPEYIAEVKDGYSSEWDGQRKDLGELAILMAGGTLTALDSLINGETLTAVNLAGAKHHAQYDHSSGFCVIGDLALAAHKLGEATKIAVLDFDAHHGDGTQNLMEFNPNWLTFSVHEGGIFPFSGFEDNPEQSVYNVPLQHRAGSSDLQSAVDKFIALAHEHQPQYIFIAGGADGHRTDPLSSLQYQPDDYMSIMGRVRREFPTTPILFGGAGGYQPDDFTPLVWAVAVSGLVGV